MKTTAYFCCAPRVMKIRYFPDTDILTIELADRVSSTSEVVSDNLIVDIGVQGKPVGVTLEHYFQISDSSTIETLLPITPTLLPVHPTRIAPLHARPAGA